MALLAYPTGYLIGAVVATIVAGIVFLARPGRRQNRLLALILFWEALVHVAAAWRVQFGFWGWTAEHLASATAFRVGVTAAPLLYLWFLSTIEVPLTRPLRSRYGTAGVWTLLLAGAGFVIVATAGAPLPELVNPGVGAPTGEAIEGLGYGLWLLAALYGLAVAIQYRGATEPGTLRHRQARAYVAAFGLRDAMIIVFQIVVFLRPAAKTWGLRGGSMYEIVPGLTLQWLPMIWGLVFAFLITYGILSTQLFGIDLKVKLGVEKSTFVGAFGVAFLAVSEGVEALLGVDGTLYGVAAAVAIGLFFRRIEEGAEYVADRLLPGVEDTPEYRARRKEEIYRAQLEELMADDQVTSKERRALLRLQEDLGLDGDTANRLERDVLGASGGEVS